VVLHYAVTDTGIGIPAEKREKIFEAFTQADGSTTRKYGGTGLGLTISRGMVEMMGGRMWIESEVGKGSTFQFTVSLGVSRTPSTRSQSASPVDFSGLRVLIVDDNTTNRRIFEELLQRWQMKPTAVDSGWLAFKALEGAQAMGEPFRLVLLDCQMPEMDGFAVARTIRENQSLTQPILIMVSSATRRGDSARAREVGIACHLSKPLKQSELRDAISRSLGAPVVPEPPTVVEPEPASHRPLRVLLAEDNAVNQKLALRILERRGHTVSVANDGREVLKRLDSQSFDLILMDVQMPNMSGFEVTTAIRQIEKMGGGHVPVIALTAHAMAGDRERCLAAGMDDYVVKPINPARLFAAIERVVPGTISGNGAAAPAGEQVLDVERTLERIGGDTELLVEVVGMFRRDCPKMVEDIRAAIAGGDSETLEREAHKLKGALSAFCAQPAFEVARKLEAMGRNRDVTRSAETFRLLEAEIARLGPVLEALSKGQLTCTS
jgi:CheY-like chemotaxis protein/HPt (histidine-containing phosphotransfer) domain-containing protein